MTDEREADEGQGMSVFGTEVSPEEYRGQWGIPFRRPGNAIDYAQCIFGLATVSSSCRVNAELIRQNQYVTGAEHVIDGGWLLEQSKCLMEGRNVTDNQSSESVFEGHANNRRGFDPHHIMHINSISTAAGHYFGSALIREPSWSPFSRMAFSLSPCTFDRLCEYSSSIRRDRQGPRQAYIPV